MYNCADPKNNTLQNALQVNVEENVSAHSVN